MRLVLLSISIGVSAYAQCIYLQCNSPPVTNTCSECKQCREKATSFCLFGSTLVCGCVSGAAKNCVRVKAQNQGGFKACKLREAVTVPTPTVRAQGSSSVAVEVQRFFSEAPFDALSLSRLTLLADFSTKGEVHCESIGALKAQKWGKNHCVLRIRLAIPGLEHKSDDNYYYDDQSTLETEFSTELFSRAEAVRFWVEIDVERPLMLAHETIIFASTVRSEGVQFNMTRTPIAAPRKAETDKLGTPRMLNAPLSVSSKSTNATSQTRPFPSAETSFGNKPSVASSRERLCVSVTVSCSEERQFRSIRLEAAPDYRVARLVCFERSPSFFTNLKQCKTCISELINRTVSCSEKRQFRPLRHEAAPDYLVARLVCFERSPSFYTNLKQCAMQDVYFLIDK